jgi:GntR family negative regulator for fad regulon and positive regulator of fabA
MADNNFPRPAEKAENKIIFSILNGEYAPDSPLLAERELAVKLGVTRPTLREALQRLARDGWLEIHHGKPTRVRDFWTEGSLAVLDAIAQRQEEVTLEFITHLLETRVLLAPAYTRKAIERAAGEVTEFLSGIQELADTPAAFAEADLALHRLLTIKSGNPIFAMILNGFANLYEKLAPVYFDNADARQRSRVFYRMLFKAARVGEPDAAEAIARRVMQESLNLWVMMSSGGEA